MPIWLEVLTVQNKGLYCSLLEAAFRVQLLIVN